MRKRSGFTLMELLIVVAIIAILAAISIPIFASQLGKTRETVCRANRRALYAVVITSYLMGDYETPSDAFAGVYGQDSAEYICPSGGTYSWIDDASGDNGHIVCSVHDEGESAQTSPSPSASASAEPSPSPSADTTAKYEGTTITLQDSYWPEQQDFSNPHSTIFVPAGGVFQYKDQKYYVVNVGINVTKTQAASGPGGTVYSWYSTQQLTGRVVTYSSDAEQKSDLERGDLCQVGNDYYVYIDGGSWAFSPTVSPSQWYKIPQG